MITMSPDRVCHRCGDPVVRTTPTGRWPTLCPSHRATQNRDRGRTWRAAHPGRSGEMSLAYYNRLPDHEKQRRQRRSSRQRYARYWDDPDFRDRILSQRSSRNSLVRHADEESKAYAFLIKNDPCSYCGGPAGTVDHIYPVSKGGSNHWSNYAAACRSCNSRKMTSHLLTFMERKLEI